MSRRSKIALVSAVAALLSGCVDYMDNRDSITLGAGNAPEGNIALHTVKPFPKSAYNTNIEMQGAKVQQAYGRYMTPCDPDIVKCIPDSGGAKATVADKPGNSSEKSGN